eukprot:COSAG04_NODE_9656_length_843_cov_1.307796_1_plen_169_part_00
MEDAAEVVERWGDAMSSSSVVATDGLLCGLDPSMSMAPGSAPPRLTNSLQVEIDSVHRCAVGVLEPTGTSNRWPRAHTRLTQRHMRSRAGLPVLPPAPPAPSSSEEPQERTPYLCRDEETSRRFRDAVEQSNALTARWGGPAATPSSTSAQLCEFCALKQVPRPAGNG